MQALKLSEKLLTVIGVFTNESKNAFPKSVNSLFILILFAVTVAASIARILKDNSAISGSTFPFIQIYFYLGEIGSFISIGMNVEKIKRLHSMLQNIVDNGKLHS